MKLPGSAAHRGMAQMVAYACTFAGAMLCGCGSDVLNVVRPDVDVPVTCENFCSTVLRRCRGKWRVYGSWQACLDSCTTWPDMPGSDFARGNTLQCRFSYASIVTLVQGAASYCENASPSGGQSCHD